MRQLRLDLPDGVPVRLGSFAVVLALAATGGWVAGQSVGPITLPDPPGFEHTQHGIEHGKAP